MSGLLYDKWEDADWAWEKRILEKREQVPEIRVEASLGGTVLTHLGALYGGLSWAEAVAAIKQSSAGVA